MMPAICSQILLKSVCKYEALRVHLKRKNYDFLIIRNHTEHFIQWVWLETLIECKACQACMHHTANDFTDSPQWVLNEYLLFA